jgi:hypothetical protein
MIPLQKHPFLVTLIVLSVIGLLACTPQPDSTHAQDVNVQPISSSPAINPTNQQPSNFDCNSESGLHTVGLSIAETYEVPYEQVMKWFCDGFSFDNILIALETSEAVDIPADVLLEMLLEKEWEQIWSEVGFMENP